MSRVCFRVNPHYSCLNVKELLARSQRKIWSLSDSNWTRTQNHLVCKQTLNHLAKLAHWLSCVVSTYLHGAFDWNAYVIWQEHNFKTVFIKLWWTSPKPFFRSKTATTSCGCLFLVCFNILVSNSVCSIIPETFDQNPFWILVCL